MARSKLFLRFLAHELVEARRAAGLYQEDAAQRLSMGVAPISRFETAKSTPKGPYVELLCDLYGVSEDGKKKMMRLLEMANRPPWWLNLGKLSESMEGLLTLEGYCHRIRVYEQCTVPGLLQTEAMAHAINDAVDVAMSPQQKSVGVDLRLQRQREVWGRPEPPEMTCIIDESALWRLPGTSDVRRSQLSRLMDPGPTVTVHVLPVAAGPTPSMGSYNIFDIDLGSSVPVQGVHIDGSTTHQPTIVESGEQVGNFELAFQRSLQLALSADDSVRRIGKMMEEIKDDEDQ